MSITHAPARTPFASRFAWLMGLHGENFRRLERLFAPQRLVVGAHVSTVDDGLDVILDVYEHHPYTIDLGLTYALRDSTTGRRIPSARIRMYRDARMAEVLDHEADPQFERRLGTPPAQGSLFDQRIQRSTFLSRWLEYLAEQGHSIGTLQRVVSEPEAASI